MKVVLGIDAAWTATQPSGVALAVEGPLGWKLSAVAASYEAFTSRVIDVQRKKPRGSAPEPSALLAAATSLVGAPVTLVAIDMPLSRLPIVSRRISDNKVSSLYGARHAGTHTPSALRPGRLSDDLTKGFAHQGYPLVTSGGTLPALIEVYPHPALIELAVANRRLPYKHGKTRAYWPEDDRLTRRRKLYEVWGGIIELLETRIRGVATALTLPDLGCRGYELKAFEDALDAVVCAWVGVCVLDGTAKPYGDDTSAIWIPNQGA